MRTISAFLLLCAVLAAAGCGGGRQQGSTVVLVVRHAERASDAEDSPLTEAGTQRAQALASAATSANVAAIYTTQFRRNRDTARPLSERAGVAMIEVPVDLQNPGDYGQRLARDILERHAGETVAVVGHGNTVASIVQGLTGRAPDLGDIQYSDLLVVTVPPQGAASLIRAQYGATTTAGGMMK